MIARNRGLPDPISSTLCRFSLLVWFTICCINESIESYLAALFTLLPKETIPRIFDLVQLAKSLFAQNEHVRRPRNVRTAR